MDIYTLTLVVIVAVFSVGVLFEAFILHEINKYFKILKSTYTYCLLVVGISWITSIMGVLILETVIPSALGVFILSILGMSLVVVWLYRKFFQVAWPKALAMYWMTRIVVTLIWVIGGSIISPDLFNSLERELAPENRDGDIDIAPDVQE